jgi:hypothetical protein
MVKRIEKYNYYKDYTFGACKDFAMSVPLGIAKMGWNIFDSVMDGASNIPSNSWENNKEYIPFYKKREKLRKNLDTLPGVKYLTSRAVASIPFFTFGIPAAILGENIVESSFPELPLAVKNTIISLETVCVQLSANYVTFMVKEVLSNKQKYVNSKGKIVPKKIMWGIKKTLKSFLPVDGPYGIIKTLGQSEIMGEGKSALLASTYFDFMVGPIAFTLAIPFGLKNKLIETKDSEKYFGKPKVSEL